MTSKRGARAAAAPGSSSPLFKGRDDESPLWRRRRRVLSAQLATLAFTLYSEYEMTAKADEEKSVCLT